MRITWLGAAGLVLEHDGRTLLIDPYITRPEKLKLAFGRLQPDKPRIRRFVKDLENVQGVLVSHTHMDHALDLPDVLSLTECPAIGGRSLRNLVMAAGLDGSRVMLMHGGEKLRLGPFEVAVLPGRHGKAVFGRVPIPGEIDEHISLPAKTGEYRHGDVWLFRICVDGICIFHQGTAEFLESSLEGISAHVLFCCVPGWRKIKERLPLMLRKLSPRIVAPFHFDDFSGFKIDRPVPYDKIKKFPGNSPEPMIDAFLGLDPKLKIQRLGIGIPWDLEV